MKKFLSLLLLAAMLLSLAACGETVAQTPEAPAETPAAEVTETPAEATEKPVEATEPPQPEAPAIPTLGATVAGFTVKDIREFPLVGATIYLFEHDRTGAHLMYIANNDTNRVFDLTFFTRAVDNTGLPHVFEHSTLDGSAKYPSKALFFNLGYQTYNTYMNAMTSRLTTTYPVASLSEAQLLKYADYYTDSCLNPTIMEDESIFREEAWRYRMASMDDPLTIEGTVYSEMRGAITLTSAAYTNILRTAFPGSTIGNISGGDPAFIPDMTWESLRDYHNLYYHPSNCIGYLYGQFDDYSAFLKLLDEAFAPYEKKEFTFDDKDYTPLAESTEVSLAFPVETGSGTENASAIFYGFICPGLKDDPEEEMLLNTLTDLMVADGSPLMQNLKKALPSGSFATYIELDGPEDMIVFYGLNLNESDAALFKSTVDDTLKDLAENGFSQDLVDSIMSSLELSIKLSSDASGVGVDLVNSIADYYASTGNMYDYMNYVESLGKLDEWNAQGLYTKAISDWLLGDTVTALSVTYPEPGLREQLDAAEAERLADVKAAMSEEELQAIIDQTNATDEEEDASEYVKQLQAVTVSSLPEELREYEPRDSVGEDGVRRIDIPADVDGVGQTILLLDASGLSRDEIHWFKLYTDLIGEMDTARHSKAELAVLTPRYLYDGEVRQSLIDTYGTDEFRPNLRASWKSTDENLAAGYDLMYEILFETDFSDAETLQGLITKNKASLKSSITSNAYSVMLYRAIGAFSPLYRYYSYYTGIEYYSFLERVEQEALENPDAVAQKLAAIQKTFHNRFNAVAVYAGSEEGIRLNAEQVDAFMAKLDQREIKPIPYAFPKPAKNEALIVDSSVQYNGIVSDFETLGLEKYTGDLDALSSLLSDAYLYPELRDRYGAYGVMNGFTVDGASYLISYRDPNIEETFAVYEDMADFVRMLDKDQEALDGYILSSYSSYAAPTGELSGAINAGLNVLTGEPQDLNLQYMRELKSLTPEKVQAYADLYEKMARDGMRFTVGGAAAVNANEELYDNILNPFGAVDTSQVALEDVPEDYEYYDAVRYLYENQFMYPLEESRFGVNDNATVGDMAIFLYTLGFGEAITDPVEARSALAEYGIMAGDMAEDAPLTEKAANKALKEFSDVVGVPYKLDASAKDQALNRGKLAQILMDYLEPLLG